MTTSEKCGIIEIDTLTKAQKGFLNFCKEFGWGKVEVTIKNGEPVMVSQAIKDTKFD